MQASEVSAAIRAMSKDSKKRFAQEILSDPDGRNAFRPELDRMVNAAVRSHDENLQAAGKLADRSDLQARLDRIEKAYGKKVRSVELSAYAKIKAHEAGIDPVLLDGLSYTEESEIDSRVELISAAVKRAKDEEMNGLLLASHRPGSGDAPEPVRLDPDDLSPANLLKYAGQR